MNIEEEFVDILGRITRHLKYSKETGLDELSLSSASLAYLKDGIVPASEFGTDSVGWQSLKELSDYISDCHRCKLARGRTNLVFGEGPPDAKLMFIGEGPGTEEDLSGKPFVGRAGKLLNDIINAMGLARKEVYICNVVKCHPPRNRNPQEDEIEVCMPFLRCQISLIRPDVICTLGGIPGQALIDKKFKVTRDRGQWYSYMDIPIMATYHPAYLLRNPKAKRHAWKDIQEIMFKLGLKIPGKDDK